MGLMTDKQINKLDDYTWQGLAAEVIALQRERRALRQELRIAREFIDRLIRQGVSVLEGRNFTAAKSQIARIDRVLKRRKAR